MTQTVDQQVMTVTTMANAVELATKVVMQISGNAIANRIQGELVTPSSLQPTIVAKIQSNFARYIGDN